MGTYALKWIRSEENPATMGHAARTALAAVISLLAARALRLPEAYWAPISTLIVVQSTWGAALKISVQRFAGTALGAFVGGIVAIRYQNNALAFGAAVFVVGILCALGGVERTAYRYASITLAIVMLVSRYNSAPTVAFHRFVEVSLGVTIGLVETRIWPEKREAKTAS